MLLRVLLFGVLTVTFVSGRLPTRVVRERDFDDVRMKKNTYDKAQMIHYNWYLHSIKAIMGSMGKELMKKLHKDEKVAFYRCLDEIKDRRDVVAAAKCLTSAKEAHEERKSSSKNVSVQTKSKVNDIQNSPAKRIVYKNYKAFQRKQLKKKESKSMKGGIQLYKSFWRKGLKILKSEKMGKSVSVSEKLKLFHRNRRLRFHRSKRSLQRLVGDTVSRSDAMRYTVKTMDHMPSLKNVGRSGVRKVTNLIREMVGIGNSTGWSASYKNLLLLKKAMDQRAKDPGAKVYDYRMLDLVMDRTAPTHSLYDKTPLPPMIQEAFNLLKSFEKAPKSVSDGSNIKFLSPRFAPIMPDKTEIRGKLSPSILPFYNDDAEEQILPIPKLLESTGMSDSDRETVMETIMELSGARETVDDAIKMLQNTNLFGMEGELKEVTERLAGYFKELEDSFNPRQRKDMKKQGFTFMETNQIEEIYEKQGIKGREDIGFNVHEYRNLTRKQREDALWMRIAKIADNGTDESDHRRSKRALFSFANPTVLAPYMFTPIYGLAILGPTVLSPSLFSPLILNPAVLSPYVLSPAVGMPFILSPYILSPYVISPLVFAPFILNPYILAPNVINPYVLSPLILSPLVLCPDVLSPMVGGGGILSPGVASPSYWVQRNRHHQIFAVSEKEMLLKEKIIYPSKEISNIGRMTNAANGMWRQNTGLIV